MSCFNCIRSQPSSHRKRSHVSDSVVHADTNRFVLTGNNDIRRASKSLLRLRGCYLRFYRINPNVYATIVPPIPQLVSKRFSKYENVKWNKVDSFRSSFRYLKPIKPPSNKFRISQRALLFQFKCTQTFSNTFEQRDCHVNC